MDAGARIQDRYTLTAPLGSGGMADVWRAHDERLERDVAVKFLRSNLATEPEFLVRFFTEAQSVARMNHPNVVSILDFGRIDDRPYLVMELVPGGALSEIVGTPLTQERALEVVGQAARGAGAAHEIGLVHRDIKPGNILLDEDGTAKITDFGIASSRGQEAMTATGTAIGSPHYISNEQVSGDRPTPRSDVYSLGVVLYELLTGKKPFEGDNITAVAIAQVEEMPVPPRTHNPDIDPAVDALVLRCMSKTPAERFEDGTALANEIDRLTSHDPAPLPVPAVVAPMEDHDLAPVDPDRQTRMMVGVVMVTLLLAAGVAVLLGGGVRDEPTAAAGVPSPTATATERPKKKPSPAASIESAPAVADAPSPSLTAEAAEEQSDESEESDPQTGTFSGDSSTGSNEEPQDEPTEEPTEEPSPEPSPEATPQEEATPDASTDDGGNAEG